MTGGEGSTVGAAGGASAPARRRSAGRRAGRPGRRASVEVWEGGGVAGLGNVGLGRPVRDELSSPAQMAAVDGVWCARELEVVL